MKILSIETSCEHASVALLFDGETVERSLEGHSNHSERLLPTLKMLLSEAGIALGALDAVAFGAGPGAFTGLRLACGVAQGLAMGADLGVAPICSLEALALQGSGDDIYVATDARMGEVYSAACRFVGGLPVMLAPPTCCPPEMLALPAGGRWTGIGSAFAVYGDRIPREVLDRLDPLQGGAVPRASDVARLAMRMVEGGILVAADIAAPLYVRDKVALTTAERLARGGRA
ncbi:tRNA (adenosine(37)-N6)-threonylcarbamoyltransferase complex dimerization subunit type 1 TsaB [Aromatoleum petrolei]|uniref:tRNA (Adenosine(37)-N6)-threonylcarbamoyltransferase complex dimerization subunit type 1 TsaB n=1 Tax=Aromatoleum petrolei TaxID=76116 RepID=A0ABX1MI19_9RHOO|nr:tRNA (adenosine(37)-N6)-threonylcarbamoyltransferase complex dimerization subunit type 1 TsaB [Aromatoleum petrolei]NMF87587.1 tRNA (adenosine(37)-N6)-threonylcarbamoyltransferase complex dimerization subunit type 1 TsaB [Aromatoleum petrolei]QTQ38685.1 tRNA threonylcarbamoyladenosine biosynthesis protein [Aromatoleum petrolei]